MVILIAAIGKNNELGKDNKLLWSIPSDLKRFKSETEGHTVIMGRKTFESIGKPLPNRDNIVITRQKDYGRSGISTSNSLPLVIEVAKKNEGKIFVIGGAQIYKEALDRGILDELHITHVDQEFDADTYFPILDSDKWGIKVKRYNRDGTITVIYYKK